MQVVQHNLASMFTQRELKITTGNKQKNTEKLSSGYRVNRGADDAAGLAISEKMRWQIRGLSRAADNIQDGISFIQTGEGALNEVHSMLQRISELAIQSANDTNTPEDREAINKEVQQIKQETQRIFDETMFNDIFIFRAPYVPNISTEPNDYQFFNVDGGSSPGGILINHKRYTWDELGVPQSSTTDWQKEFTDDNGELIKLFLPANTDRSGLQRVYELDANDQGILINNLLAGTWDGTITQNGDEYSFTFHGMEISFTADAGATRDEIITHLKPDGISHISWNASPAGSAGAYAVISDADTMTLNVTNSNKTDIRNYRFQINADEEGVWISRSNTADASDTQTGTKTKWENFTDTSGNGHNILDWGTVSDNANPITLDDDARFTFTDATSWNGKTDNNLEFAFRFGNDEVSRSEAIIGLTQSLSAPSVSAPIASVTSTTGATAAGNFSFEFQRDELLRDFGSSGSSAAMTATVERTQSVLGTVTDHEERNVLTAAYVHTNATVETYQNYVFDGTWSYINFEKDGVSYQYKSDGTLYDITNERYVTDGSVTVTSVEPPETPSDERYKTGESTEDVYVLQTGYDTDSVYSNTEMGASYSGVRSSYVATVHFGDGSSIDGTIAMKLTGYEEKVYTGTYETSGSGLRNYISDGSGGYLATGESDYYVIGSGSDLDADGNQYQSADGAAAGVQRYVMNGTMWVATDTYDLDRYSYAAKNTDGDTILSSQSGQFLNTNGTGSATKTIYDASGNATTYLTDTNNTIKNTTLTNSSYSSASNYLNMNYTTGSGDRTNTVTITPSGNATATFSKAARSAGSSASTNLKVTINPPEKLLHIQSGALAWQDIPLRWNSLNNSIIGISTVQVKTYGQAQAAIGAASGAIDYISGVRSLFGAYQNRLEHAYAVDRNTEENTQAAESRIRDTDMAKEMVSYAKNEILAQAGQAMLVQANQQPSGILTLLQ